MTVDTKARGSAKSSAAASPSQNAGDPLADALLFLAAHHGRAISREALMAGLPVLDGRLPPPLFERAAAKAGLEGKAVRRKLAEIPALVLPAVLSMRDGSTRILLAIDLDTKMATVVNPSSSARPQSRPMRELNAEYLGFAFLVRPAASADARAVAAGDLPRRALVLVGRAPLLVELQPRRGRGTDHQRACAREPPLHHERLRPRGAERRHGLAGRAVDRYGDRGDLRFRHSHGAQPHHRHDGQEARRDHGLEHLRARTLGEVGAAAGLGRHPRQPDPRFRTRYANFLLLARSSQSPTCFSPLCSSPSCT